MANIMVTNPEAFSAEFEEFEIAIREEMEQENAEISQWMKIFGMTREEAENAIIEEREQKQSTQMTTEELIEFFRK